MKHTASWLLVVLAVTFGVSGAVASENQPVRQIVVMGEGSAAIAPDMAILSLTVRRDGKTAREALSASSKAMADVIAVMKGSGIAPRDLQTSGLNIQPRYSYPQRNKPDETRRLIGYEVRNSLTVKVRDLDRVGEILDESVTLGVNEGGNVIFANADPAEALGEARVNAVAEAKKKARTLAAAAGVELGEVMHISEQTISHYPRPMDMGGARMMAAEAATVPIEGGEKTYRVNVHMTFAIAP